LLSKLTGHSLLLASSGLQSGLDSRTSYKSGVHIAVECKRYHESRPLSQRELLGEINAAVTTHTQLDCWILAATRPITAQEEFTLEAECKARGIEYLTLGCAILPNVGLLDALCASQADRALEYLRTTGIDGGQIRKFAQATKQVANRPETMERIVELRKQLSVPNLGFAAFRNSLNHRLSEDLIDAARCKRRFRCTLSPHALPEGLTSVPRPLYQARLHQLWREAVNSVDHKAVVVLGEEGDGKSWIVAEWIADLMSTPDPPAVFFISAREPMPSISETLNAHVHEYAGIRTSCDVSRLLDRWFCKVPQRRAVIVFDGLNERLDRPLWSDLITDTLQKYSSSIFLVLTCRKKTWHAVYEPVMLHKLATLPIDPFDDQEFSKALGQLPVKSRNALVELGPLVRRPRYFHCACEHALKLESTYELSIPLLYYLDWRHRQSRRPLLSLSTEDFEQGLMELARDQYDSLGSGQQATSTYALGDHTFHQHLEELSSGGVLRRSGPLHRWRVEEPFLALGFGMYLASLLEEAGESIDARCELAFTTLGDTSTWDLTAEVMQQALLHTLHRSSDFSVETQIALLSVWTQCLNGLDQAANTLPKLAALEPNLIFHFADRIWRSNSSDHLIETATLEALIRVLRHPAHEDFAASWLSRWAGGVHPLGESSLDDDDPKVRTHIDVDRLCSSEACALPSSGIVLHRELNRADIRLGRLTLAAISACDRRIYWQALVTAIVANEAMGATRCDVLAWIVRSSAQPLDDLAETTVTKLLSDHEPICDRAAQRLLMFLGSPALMHRLAEIPPIPASQWNRFQEEYNADPCNCFFIAPPRSIFIDCLSRTDVPYRLNACRANSLAADRDVEFPDAFTEQVRNHARTIDVSRLQLQMGTDSEDLKWRDLEPLLCRLDPNLFADIVRRFAATAKTREGLALRQLSWSIKEYTDLLCSDEVAALMTAWERHSATHQPDSEDDQFVESMLAQAILPHLAASAQFEFLMNRPRTSHEMLSMEYTFKPLFLEEQAQWLAPTSGNTRSMRIALWFSLMQPDLNLDVLCPLIDEALRSDESGARGLSLTLLQRIDRSKWSSIGEILRWTDKSDFWTIERFYGTLMVMQTTTPSAESLARCSKAHMGEALVFLDSSQAAQWGLAYADILMTTIRHLAINAPAMPAHPAINIATGSKRHPWQRISINHSQSSTLRFIAPMSSWGGLKPGEAQDLASAFNHDKSDAHDMPLDAALDMASSQGDWLFATHIPPKAIALIVQSDPSFIDKFEEIFTQAEVTGLVGRILPVTEAMTSWGLRSGIAAAEQWFDRLETGLSLVSYEDAATGLSSRKAALFTAPASPSIEARWRNELNSASSDHELYRVVYTLDTCGHRQWLLDEASSQFSSEAPRGRSLCISILAALRDDGQSLRHFKSAISIPESSWYSDLLELAQNYARRGKDYRYWLQEAISHDNAAIRVRSAHLALHIEDHRASLIRAQLFNDSTLTEASRLWLRRSGPFRERNSRSDWQKNLEERFFGYKKLDHAVAPWLPIPNALQQQ
jgi:hypothetical protein